MYNRPRIIPVLLIKDRDLVKTINFSSPTYLGDPINAVKIFNIKNVDELCILDISENKDSEPDYDLLSKIANQAFMPLGYGGKIHTVEQALKILSLGYEKIIINSCFFDNPDLITEIAKRIGNQSVVVSIDVKKEDNSYCIYSKNGKLRQSVSLEDALKKAEAMGAGEVLLNNITLDGMMTGYDLELVKKASLCLSIPLIVCGGACNVDDLKKALDSGAHAVAAGSMFVFYGRLRAVLITFPSEDILFEKKIYNR